MGERESYAPGTFCWVDLGTTDAAGAKAFYGRVFGWEGEDMPVGDGATYTMLRLGGRDVAAVYEQGEDERAAGIPPHWSSYISVVDVDETAARVEGLGGKLLAEPFDVLDSGRMAVVQDPTGALVSLWQPGRHVGARLVNDPGSLTWNDLATPDPDAAAAFYTALLGWEVQQQAPVYSTITNEGRGQRRHPARDGPAAALAPVLHDGVDLRDGGRRARGGRPGARRAGAGSRRHVRLPAGSAGRAVRGRRGRGRRLTGEVDG